MLGIMFPAYLRGMETIGKGIETQYAKLVPSLPKRNGNITRGVLLCLYA